MDASGTDSVPVVCRRKTGGRCGSRPMGSSWALCSDAAAALACLVAFSLMGQAQAYYSCSTKADCNYDGCANRACSSSSSYCNNGVWDYECYARNCWGPTSNGGWIYYEYYVSDPSTPEFFSLCFACL